MAGLAAIAVQIDDLIEGSKGTQVSSMTLGTGLVGVDINCLVGAGQFSGVHIPWGRWGTVTVVAHLRCAGLASCDSGDNLRLGAVVADRAGIGHMDAADDIHRAVTTTAIEGGGTDFMGMAGVRGILIGMT
jgi:hypothetical protein